MIALKWLEWTFGSFFITFVFFCAVLKLREVRDAGYIKQAPIVVRVFAWGTLILGLVADAVLNVCLSPILLEPPRIDLNEWLTTYRVSRLKKEGNGWQKSCANWLCKQLDAFDSNHCG
jgi:hypothetical protein